MAKTGINITQCNIATAEIHNSRDPKYMNAVNASPKKKYSIFEDRSSANLTWINPAYTGKTLPQLLDEFRQIYRDKVGQSPQEKDRIREITDKKTGMKRTVTTPGWAPIREGVCPVTADTKLEDFDEFKAYLKSEGLDVIRIDIHRDEGHVDLETGERVYNNHAHIIIDWLDHATGKTVKLNKIDASQMQTKIAESLGMERGISKELTGADHLDADQQRAKAEAEELRRLKDLVKEVEQERHAALLGTCNMLQKVGHNNVVQFDSLCKLGNADVVPTEEERDNRDKLKIESERDISAFNNDELGKFQKLLHILISSTIKAINRLSKKLTELSDKVRRLEDIRELLIKSNPRLDNYKEINAELEGFMLSKESIIQLYRGEAVETKYTTVYDGETCESNVILKIENHDDGTNCLLCNGMTIQEFLGTISKMNNERNNSQGIHF